MQGVSTRVFTDADQSHFAELSGDFNPMHLDALAARRLIFGRRVVHGIHMLLWGLDNWLAKAAAPVSLTRLSAVFLRPLGVEETVNVRRLVDDTLTRGSDVFAGLQLHAGL